MAITSDSTTPTSGQASDASPPDPNSGNQIVTPGGDVIDNPLPGLLGWLVGTQANEGGFDYWRLQGSPGGSITNPSAVTDMSNPDVGFGAYQFSSAGYKSAAEAADWTPRAQDAIAATAATNTYNDVQSAHPNWTQDQLWQAVSNAWATGSPYSSDAGAQIDFANVKLAQAGKLPLPSQFVYGSGYTGTLTSAQVASELGGTAVAPPPGSSGTPVPTASSGSNTSPTFSGASTMGKILIQLDLILNPQHSIQAPGTLESILTLGAADAAYGISDVAMIVATVIFRGFFVLGFLALLWTGIQDLTEKRAGRVAGGIAAPFTKGASLIGSSIDRQGTPIQRAREERLRGASAIQAQGVAARSTIAESRAATTRSVETRKTRRQTRQLAELGRKAELEAERQRLAAIRASVAQRSVAVKESRESRISGLTRFWDNAEELPE